MVSSTPKGIPDRKRAISDSIKVKTYKLMLYRCIRDIFYQFISVLNSN